MRIRPKNWEAFQHYKDREPPWIKLHHKLLDDFEFQSLPVASRALAPMLWLLASEDRDGWIDASNAKIAFRLRMNVAEFEEALRPLISAEFFEVEHDAIKPLAEREQDATPETEAETQVKAEKETQVRLVVAPPSAPPTPSPKIIALKPKAELPELPEFLDRSTRWPKDAVVSEDWISDAMQARFDLGLPIIDLKLDAANFADYWSSKPGKDGRKLDWRKTWLTWARNSRGHANGQAQRTANDKFLAGGAAFIADLERGMESRREGEGDLCDAGGVGSAVPSLRSH